MVIRFNDLHTKLSDIEKFHRYQNSKNIDKKLLSKKKANGFLNCCSSTSVYVPSTWTCCARPRESLRKWRQGGYGGSQFHSGSPLDYKLGLTEPGPLLGNFSEPVFFGTPRRVYSRRTGAWQAAGRALFGGIYRPRLKVVELAVSSVLSLGANCGLRSTHSSSRRRSAVFPSPIRPLFSIIHNEKQLYSTLIEPQVCRARYSHVCLASCLFGGRKYRFVWSWKKGGAQGFPSTVCGDKLRSYRLTLKSWLVVGLLGWFFFFCQHAQDPAVFTRHPHFSRRNVENMGLHHVHPQEAHTNGETWTCKSMKIVQKK